jgi:hypothetical protein
MKTIEKAALNCNKEYSLQPAPAYLGFIQGVKFAQEWIPVEEELPRIGEKVITKMNKDKRTSYGIATRIREEWEIDAHWIDHTFSNMNITHWRPIELK